MKQNKFFGLAAIVCGLALTMGSCTSKNDNPILPPEPIVPTNAVIGFEGAALNADGYWCGDENGEKFDNWGSEAYACSSHQASFPNSICCIPPQAPA